MLLCAVCKVKIQINISVSLLLLRCIVVGAVLLPRTVRATVGEPLVVTCIIPTHLAGVCDSSGLAFDLDRAGDIEVFDDRLISRVNGSVAVLSLSESLIDWDDAFIGCYVKNLSFYGNSHVRVFCKCFVFFSLLVSFSVKR